MAGFFSGVEIQRNIAVATIILILALAAGSYSWAQVAGDAPYDAAAQPAYAMSQNELENLVAPIALYPDGLLGQVLVASTYPDEVVEAQWWIEDNRNLSGPQLMEAARQQNWDPSVQLLVAFPDVVALLNRDVRWTTALGNAFLAQQADVMNAVQNLRAEAQGNGQLASTPQLSVNTEWEGDRSAIAIQPADPQRMFVPAYDPSVVWGPPAEGAYPALPYAEGSGFGSLVGTVANLAGLLPGIGLLGPRGWGWALGWLAQTLFVNNSFFSDFGFHGYGGSDRGTSVWSHNGGREFGGRYGNNSLSSWRGRGGIRQGGEGWNTFGRRSRIGSGWEGRDTMARNGFNGGQSFRGGNRAEQGGSWGRFNGTHFNGSGGMNSGGGYGRTGLTASRFGDHASQRDYRGGRNSYVANSSESRRGSFGGARSLETGRGYNGFSNSGSGRRGESSPEYASRSWGNSQQRSSAARMSPEHGSSFARESSSRRNSSWNRGSSSHSHSFKQPKAPKYKAPHYAKSHGGGGGHFSGGHSGKKSHRG